MKTVKKLASVLIAVAILCSMCLVFASAEGSVVYGAATVNATELNLREAGSKDSRVIATIPDDAVVVINEKTSKEWYKVTYDGTSGYVSSEYLTQVCTAEDFEAFGKVTGDYVNVRALPGPSGAIRKTLEGGSRIDIIGVNNGWYILDVDGVRGYMRSDYVKLVSEKDADLPLFMGESGKPTDPDADLAQQVVDFALQYVGYPYVYGASGPYSFDCSGFVMYVYGQFGYELYHGATGLYDRYGTYVEREDLQPGDLVFFYPFWSDGQFYVNHVGIYIGNDQFVHASNSSTGVIISDMTGPYGSWYDEEYVGAKRIL